MATIGGVIFAGSQDQGTQRFNGTYGTDIKAATQIIATDYVRLNVTGNGTKLWAEYPNIGTSNYNYYFDNPLTATNATASVNTQSVGNANIQYWVIPTCNWSDPSVNAILMGGGNITGGNTESHLIKLTYNGSSIVRTQYAFDFKANGGSFITAVDHSPVDANYMYVGLKNGKFYYSQDAGTSWTQTSGFTGPTGGFSYGSFIHASRVDKNLVFFSGSGGHIYKSTDGGVSFSDMSTGLPNTFVAQMVLNPSKTLLFAATDAGPYVCVLSTGQWYSMANSTTPNKAYTAVEYVTGENIARFSTYGRGVWDFVISSQILPVSYSSFDVKGKDQQAYISWATADEQDLTHYEVERSLDGVHFSTIQTVKANNKASRYQLIDKNPQEGINYYRIKSNASTGKAEYTAIKSITIDSKGKSIAVYPTLLHRNDPLSISTPEGSYEVVVYDSKGQVLWQQKLTSTVQQVNIPMLSSGVYVYVIQESKGQKVKTGKLMVL
ncbi:MAG: T9SS type A sorting domain-containing protein [Saprospiraceae bacterium]|nr:T9SS type A sorting domain-containing protein [Saprospiraceae bacterium]